MSTSTILFFWFWIIPYMIFVKILIDNAALVNNNICNTTLIQ